MTLPPDTSHPSERDAALRQRLLARGPRLTWSIADYGPPAQGERAIPDFHGEGVGREHRLDLWHAWVAVDNVTLYFGPFATEDEAREALANPVGWA